jgi:hypothetical protein
MSDAGPQPCKLMTRDAVAPPMRPGDVRSISLRNPTKKTGVRTSAPSCRNEVARGRVSACLGADYGGIGMLGNWMMPCLVGAAAVATISALETKAARNPDALYASLKQLATGWRRRRRFSVLAALAASDASDYQRRRLLNIKRKMRWR